MKELAVLPPGSSQEIANTLGHVLVDVTVDHNTHAGFILYNNFAHARCTYSSMHDAIRHG